MDKEREAKIKVLSSMLKEYELLARYNGGDDYARYCALEFAIQELKKNTPKTAKH